MTIAEQLDLAIKLKETGTTDGAYVVELINGKKHTKKTYMTKEEWNVFEADMKANDLQPNAHTEYGKGGGDELTEKNGRPPKMASYGSSSRMVYNLSRNKAGFHYEESSQHQLAVKRILTAFAMRKIAMFSLRQNVVNPIPRKVTR